MCESPPAPPLLTFLYQNLYLFLVWYFNLIQRDPSLEACIPSVIVAHGSKYLV